MKVSLNNILYLPLLFVIFIIQVNNAHTKESITIGDINTISLDEVGTLNMANGGLSADIWNGSRRQFVESLLVALPIDIKSQAGKNLRKKLLLTSAIPPKAGTNNKSSLIIIRLKLLAQLGDYENIGQMIKLIPDSEVTEQIRQIYAASAYIAEDYNNACLQVQKFLPKYRSLFWREALIICEAYNKNDSKVSLNMTLLKEDGHKTTQEFNTTLQSFQTGDNYQGAIEWNNILKNGILKLPKVHSAFPDMQKLNYSKLDNMKLEEWFEKNKELPNEEKIKISANLYANIAAFGVPVLQKDWEQFIMYAISNKAPIPAIAIYNLLNSNISKGETILLVLHSFNNDELNNMPHFLFVKILKSLHDIGLKNEAVQLANEIL